MMKKLIVCSLFILLIAGCGEAERQHDPNVASSKFNSPFANVVLELQDKVLEGDYELAIYSRKTEYAVNESVIIFAELTYIGEQKEIEITHTMYPVSFGTVENTRNAHFARMIDQPLGTTLLKKNEPMLYAYQFNGALFPISDNSEHADFMDELSNHTFPVGEYTITAYADFKVQDEAILHHFDASITFEVVPEKVQ